MGTADKSEFESPQVQDKVQTEPHAQKRVEQLRATAQSSNHHRPQMIRYHSSPAIPSTMMSPTRQKFRLGNSRPREVKETMDAKYRADHFGRTVIINQYKLKNDIARASYGTVKVAIDETTNHIYAVKEYSKRQLQRAGRVMMMRQRRTGGVGPSGAQDYSPLGLVRHEVAIMKKLDHPNIVSLVEVLDDPHGDSLYMILEWCEKGVVLSPDFEGPSSPYSEEQCRLIFRDLILAVEYLHFQGVIHRDIKVDNILIDEDDVVKLVDFGVAEIFEQDNDIIKKTAGSPAYMAPELARLSNGSNIEQVQQVAGRPADLWSMGVTLYFLLTGRLPFKADTLMELFDRIIMDPVNLDGFSDKLKGLFSGLLEKDPSKRMKMTELRNHPWVTLDGQDDLLSTEENTSDSITPITEEDLQSAFEQIKGVMDEGLISAKLKRLHGWRGTSTTSTSTSTRANTHTNTASGSLSSSSSSSIYAKSCDSSPELGFDAAHSASLPPTPPLAPPAQNFERLSRALDEIIYNKRSISNPMTPSPLTGSHSDSEQPPSGEPHVERRRRRSRSRTRHQHLHPLSSVAADRAQSLDPDAKL